MKTNNKFNIGPSSHQVKQLFVEGKLLSSKGLTKDQKSQIQGILGRLSEENEIDLNDATISFGPRKIQIWKDKSYQSIENQQDSDKLIDKIISAVHQEESKKSSSTLKSLAKSLIRSNKKQPPTLATQLTYDWGDQVEKATFFEGSSLALDLRHAGNASEWDQVLQNEQFFHKPVNLWMQEISHKETPEKVSRIARLGAITDTSNGFYSLDWLKKLEQSLNAGKEITPDHTALKMIEEKQKEIKKRWREPPHTLGKALAALKLRKVNTPNQQKVLKNEYEKLENLAHILIKHPDAGQHELRNLIKQREDRLTSQFLTYLQFQLEHHKDELEENGDFSLYQLSLLSPSKKVLDSSGVMIDEGVAYKDMEEIFAKFLRTPIEFREDLQSPKYDEENHILLLPQVNPNVNRVNLQACLENVPVHGKDAEGFKAALEKAREEREYSTAFGVCCMSGKDRTGYTVSQLMQDAYENNVGPGYKSPHRKTAILPGSIGSQIVQKNLPRMQIYRIEPSQEAMKEADMNLLQRVSYYVTAYFTGKKAKP